MRGEGPRLTLGDDIRRALNGDLPAADISSRTVAAAMTRDLVAGRGGQMMLSEAGQPFVMFGAHIPG